MGLKRWRREAPSSIQIWYLFLHFTFVCSDEWLTDSRFIIGSLLFWTGFAINLSADSVLLSLKGSPAKITNRKTQEKVAKEEEEVKKAYKIPYGNLFEYVSCANYCKWISCIICIVIECSGFALIWWSHIERIHTDLFWDAFQNFILTVSFNMTSLQLGRLSSGAGLP